MTHKIGEVIFADGVIEVNAGKPVTKLVVTNTGDRTIQVCSHYVYCTHQRTDTLQSIELALDRDENRVYRRQ